ncbi:hypothetical protein [Endozoicomonas sp. 4G]|uniref:hypothetical protein n=1 Tax=Endozoicomonas sp. 4G TaxID=2872754 RepID=UPI0020786397|nr:hypothetical protein [Endozoicomonas sp. 4G]
MRKGHLAALAFGFGILAIAAGLYLMEPVDESPQEPADSPVVETSAEPEADLRAPEEEDVPLQGGDVTRIIIDDEAEDISHILSDKVLIDDEVVDQSKLDKPGE